MTYVKGHYRKNRAGRRVWIKGYVRIDSKTQTVPVSTNNPTVQVPNAEYDPVAKATNINVVDEEPDKIIFVSEVIPKKIDKVIADDKDDVGVIIIGC